METSKDKLVEALYASGFELEFIDNTIKVLGVDSPDEYLIFHFDEQDDISNITGQVSDE